MIFKKLKIKLFIYIKKLKYMTRSITNYITQSIELSHHLDNLNLLVKNEATELIVNLNYEEKEKVLYLTNFNNLKKLVIKKILYGFITKKKIYIQYNLELNTLNVISSSIIKINCTCSNISYITNLPTTLTHLRCSNNNILCIKYLPPTLKVLELSNCNLANNKIKLNVFYLPELEVLKINSNKIQSNIEKFIPQTNNLKTFECKNNKLSKLELTTINTENLEILKCSSNQLVLLDNLPEKIKILDCSHNLITYLHNLPHEIEILDCSNNKLVELDYLPSSIIKINCSYNQLIKLDNLPNSIETLILNCNPIIELENLPQSIKNLIFNGGDKFKNNILNPPLNLEKVIILNNNQQTEFDYSNIIMTPKIKILLVSQGEKTINLIK